MKQLKSFSYSIIICIIQFFISLYFMYILPTGAKIPSHFNIHGDVDQYVSKWNSLFIFIGLNIFMIIFMILFPKISPRFRQQAERFHKIIPKVTAITVLFLALIHISMLALAKWDFVQSKILINLLIGILFILLGNLFPKIPSNFFMGIRTPWTLSSENVWRKTHRIGGITFVIGGLLMIINCFIKSNFLYTSIQIFSISLVIIIPILYSFIAYRVEKK